MQEALTIILPCYNPVEGWEKNVVANVKLIQERIPLQELILVNDGSNQDLTDEVNYIREQVGISFQYVHDAANRGKGYAIRQGLQKATSPFIIYTDIDFPYTLESLVNIYSALKSPEKKVVIGVKDGKYYDAVPMFRKWISKSLRKMITIVFNIQTADTQCGLKGIQSSVKHIWLEGKIDRYLFDLEAIYNATKKEIPIVTLPVTLRQGVTFSKIPVQLLMKEVRNFLTLVIRK